MFLKKIAQGAALFLWLGSLQAAIASSPLREWEGVESPEEYELKNNFDEGKTEVPENLLPEVIDVAIMPQRKRNEPKMPRRDLSMIALPSNALGPIQDDTAITGENAKKKLPSSVKRGHVTPPSYPSPYCHGINQIISPPALPAS